MAAKKTTTKAVPAKKAAKKTATKTAKKAAPAKKAAKKAANKVTKAGFDEIAAEAYYIYRERVGKGLPGDPQSDWLAAEKKLKA